jgi:hypothetical protein
MKRVWCLVSGLAVATTTYAIAEELTLTTYYPSPRGVYNELVANRFTDLGDTSKFLDADGISQLRDLQISGEAILGPEGGLETRAISSWRETLPPASVLLFAAGLGPGDSCPPGYAKATTASRGPRIAGTGGGSGGEFFTDPVEVEPGSVTGVAAPPVGAKKSPAPAPGETGSAGHRHPEVIPPVRTFVFCQRAGVPPGAGSPLAPLIAQLDDIDAQIDDVVFQFLNPPPLPAPPMTEAQARAQLAPLMNQWLDLYIQLGASGRMAQVLTPEQLQFFNDVDADRATFIDRYSSEALGIDPDAMTDAEWLLWEGITGSIWLYLAL